MAEKKQWCCIVCGYIHEGPEAPEVCPVCSASQDQFEPVASRAAEPGKARWQCQVCGYIHHGDSAPESCPVCGASAERFGEMRPEALLVRKERKKRRR